MKDNGFSYHLTKYFSDYLPRQTAASVNTIRSYRDTFVQLLSFYKQVYSRHPKNWNIWIYIKKDRRIPYMAGNRKKGWHSHQKPEACSDPCILPVHPVPGPSRIWPMCGDSFRPIQKGSYGTNDIYDQGRNHPAVSIPDQRDMKQLRDLAIMILLYESGGRVQEIIDLCPRSIRFGTTNTVELHGKGNKTRLVPVNADAAAIVRNYICRCKRTDVNERLFVNRKGEKLTRAGIQYIIDKYVSIARSTIQSFSGTG